MVLGEPRKKLIGLVFLALFLFLYLFRLSRIPEDQIPAGKRIRVIGRISKQPYLKASNQIINVGPILIKTPRFPRYFYGQKIEITGKFQKRVLNRFRTQFISVYPTIRLLEEEKNLELTVVGRRVLFRGRDRLAAVINRLLAEPESSLLNGILLGAKKEMPPEFWQNLRKTGTLHIVVASGQNVSLVARFLIGLLVWFINRRRALIVAGLGVVLYVLLVGAEAPVVRAGIMALLAYAAQLLGRESEGTIALVVTASLMLLVWPLILFDIGFQLSLAATAGILWLYPFFKKQRIFSWPVFGEGLATTLAAQLGTMPILLNNFGQISFLSPLVNALILWVVPLATVLGSLMAFLGLFVKPLAGVLSWFVWLLLKYFVIVINTFSSVPWLSLKIEKLAGWWSAGYYLALGIILVRAAAKQNKKEQ